MKRILAGALALSLWLGFGAAAAQDLSIRAFKGQWGGSAVANNRDSLYFGVTIRDLNRRFEWRLPDEEASTIAGLVLYEARRIPVVGQVFVFHGFRFEILSRQRNQITSI